MHHLLKNVLQPIRRLPQDWYHHSVSLKGQSGVHFMYDSSTMIQIWRKLGFSITPLQDIISQWNFAHDMYIIYYNLDESRMNFPSNLSYDGKNRSWNGNIEYLVIALIPLWENNAFQSVIWPSNPVILSWWSDEVLHKCIITGFLKNTSWLY